MKASLEKERLSLGTLLGVLKERGPFFAHMLLPVQVFLFQKAVFRL
jgi:hypothetical protein